MIRFIRYAAKAVTGALTTALSIPVVQTLINDYPLDWRISLGAGVIVGVTVYASPKNKPTN